MRAFLGGLIVVGLLAASVARAEDAASLSPAERTRRSRAHFDLGRAHFNLGEFEAAISEFEEGYRLKPLPLFLYNIAHSARRAGHPEKALELFRRYLEVNPGASEKREVERVIGELERELAARPAAPAPPVELQTNPQNSGQTETQTNPQNGGQTETQISPQNEPQSPPRPDAPIDVAPLPPEPPRAQPSAVAPPGPTALTRLSRPRAWYRDWLGWAITTVGTFAFTVGIIDFGVTYPRYAAYGNGVGQTAQSYDDARSAASRLPIDIAVFSIGAAVIAGGVVRFALVARKAKREQLSIVPAGLGIALSGRF